jgi:hypothetical protein
VAEIREVLEPYPGLRPFESSEGEIFFGREAHTDRLLEILQREHFLAVIGPSGSGKSSLVRAGLLPSLALGSIGTGSDWRIAILKPGNRPIQRLAAALLGRDAIGVELVGTNHVPRNDGVTPEVALAEAELRRGPLGLLHLTENAARKQALLNSQAPNHERFNLLVIVDQFEEIFTHADAGDRQADESEGFVNLLLAAREVKEARVFVTITMRTDFLGACVRFLDLPDAINRAQYLTPRLTREQIGRAITGPARVFGGDVEPALTDELINTVGSDQDQLPVLQHTLARMWLLAKKRDSNGPVIASADLTAVGGMREALSRHADQVLAALPPNQQEVAEWLFRAITEQREAEAGGQAVRRPQSLRRIAAWSERSWQDFLPVVQAFSRPDVSFLHFQGELGEEAVIDISHEALIRNWVKLRKWVADESQRAREFRRWRDRAYGWKNGGDLLTRADLARAVEWRDSGTVSGAYRGWSPTAAWAHRYRQESDSESTKEIEIVLELIAESESVLLAAQRRERRIKRSLVVLTACSIAASVLAGIMAYRSDRQAVSIEATSIWTQFSYSEGELSPTEDRSLLKLSRSGNKVKQDFLRQLLVEDGFAKRFRAQPAPLLQAAVGTSLKMRGWLLDLERGASIDTSPSALDRRVARALLALHLGAEDSGKACVLAMAEAPDRSRLRAVAATLAKAAAVLPEPQTPAFAAELLAAAKRAKSTDEVKALGDLLRVVVSRLTDGQLVSLAEVGQLDPKAVLKLPLERAASLSTALLGEAKRTKSRKQLGAFADGLAAVAAKLPPAQAGPFADALVVEIQSTRISSRFIALGRALAAVATQIPEAQAPRIAAALLAQAKRATMGDQLLPLGVSLAEMAARLPEAQCPSVARVLLASIKSTTDPAPLKSLGAGLVAAAARLPERQAGSLADAVLVAIRHTTDSDQKAALGAGLAALAGRLASERGLPVASSLLEAMNEATDPEELEALGTDFSAVAARLPEAQARPLAAAVLTAIRGSTDSDQLATLGRALGDLAARLPEAEASATAETLVIGMRGEVDFDQDGRITEALAAMTGSLPGPHAGALARTLLNRMKRTTNSGEFQALGGALAAMVPRLPETQVRSLLDFLRTGIKRAKDPAELHFLGGILGNLAAAGKGGGQLARPLTDWLVAETTSKESFSGLVSPISQSALAAARFPPELVSPVAEALLAEIAHEKDPGRLGALNLLLGAMADKLPERLLRPVAGALIEAIKRTVAPLESLFLDRQALLNNRKALAIVAGRLPSTQAQALALSLLPAIRQTKDSVQLDTLSKAFAAAAAGAPEAQAPSLTLELLDAIQRTADPAQLNALGQCLAAAIARIREANASPVAAKVLSVLRQDGESLHATAVEKALGPLGLKVADRPELIFEILKYPLVPRDELAEAVRSRNKDAPPKGRGYWEFLEWAAKRFPEIDLGAPAK